MKLISNIPIEFAFGPEVDNSIQAAMLQALNARSGEVTQALVQAALSDPGEVSYGRREKGDNVITLAIKAAIRKAAEDQAGAYIAEHAEEIRAAVDTELCKMLDPKVVADNVADVLSRASFQVRLGKVKRASDDEE